MHPRVEVSPALFRGRFGDVRRMLGLPHQKGRFKAPVAVSPESEHSAAKRYLMG
jgi:hypothetical protein